MSNITVPYSVNAINGHSSSYSKGNYTFTTTINLPKVQPTYLWFQHADQSATISVDNNVRLYERKTRKLTEIHLL